MACVEFLIKFLVVSLTHAFCPFQIIPPGLKRRYYIPKEQSMNGVTWKYRRVVAETEVLNVWQPYNMGINYPQLTMKRVNRGGVTIMPKNSPLIRGNTNH